jgi:hypothetical protein
VLKLSLVHIATVQQARGLLDRLGCHATGVDLMAPKALLVGIRIDGLLPQAANILKQEMLAKGGEVAVPAGALRMEADRVSCIALGTLSQFARLDQVLQEQPFELPELASRLRLLCALTTSKASRHSFGSTFGTDVGGLVDCDRMPPGVHDRIANTIALAWNLLEQRCTFLVVEGSDSSMVHQVVEGLAGTAACPVTTWVHGSRPIAPALSMPMIVEEGCRMQPDVLTDGPVFALCSSPNPVDFLQDVVSAGVDLNRLFVTCALNLDPTTPTEYPGILPRVDAVILRQQDIVTLSIATQASALTSLLQQGVCAFITDAPSRIDALLTAVRQNPWRC